MNEELVQDLEQNGFLKTPAITEAFLHVKREDFVPESLRPFAYTDEPLAIGQGQTISQPATVAFMLELLQPKEGQVILDVGAGSGWTTALLGHIVGPKGKVVGIEILHDVAEFGRKNLEQYHGRLGGVTEYFEGDGSLGYRKAAPFDGILVSAALYDKEFPSAWRDQLKVTGSIVVPILSSVWVFQKNGQNSWEEKEYPGFTFVPYSQP